MLISTEEHKNHGVLEISDPSTDPNHSSQYISSEHKSSSDPKKISQITPKPPKSGKTSSSDPNQPSLNGFPKSASNHTEQVDHNS